MGDWTWLVEFFFGMFIGYYAISPRLRGFINKLVAWLYRRMRHETTLPQVVARYSYSNKPKSMAKPIEPETVSVGSKGGIAVDEDTFEKWMESNSDLKKLNKVGAK